MILNTIFSPSTSVESIVNISEDRVCLLTYDKGIEVYDLKWNILVSTMVNPKEASERSISLQKIKL